MAEAIQVAWRPTPQQELLVRAALGEGDEAAWAQWIEAVDVERLDPGSNRILPLLYRNLVKLGIRHPQSGRIGGAYRQTWAKNQYALYNLTEIIGEFEKRGITTLLLKGAALLLRYYHDVGARSMVDLDLLVPMEQTDAAIAFLVERGWQSEIPLSSLTADGRTPFHGMNFYHETKHLGFDLHWHIMHLQLASHYDAPMWAEALPLQLGTVETRVLCPEDQLIHTLYNGCINEEGLNLRWLPDALLLLKNEPDLKWDGVVERCRRLQFTHPVAEMLDYLRHAWNIPVPVDIVEKLAHMPVSYRMRQVYAALNVPKHKRSNLQMFWVLYTEYLYSQSPAQRYRPLGFIRFLRHRWSLDDVGQTLRYAIQRTRGVPAEKAKELA